VEVDPVSRNTSLEWRRLTQHVLSIPEDREDIPLYMQNTRQAYWSRYLEREGVLYIQYNQCREDPKKPFRPFARGIGRELRRGSVQKLVIDLRFNGGGDSRVLHPLIRTLERDYREGREYELYTIIGRGTFSSAVLNAIDLDQRAGAVLVGEPSAGRPNHYGEVKSMRLPHSGMRLFYSTKYFSRYEKDTDALYPDISARWSFADITTWDDEAMEAVRAQ
jgi:C-terminal processing protease CtpA/Prc